MQFIKSMEDQKQVPLSEKVQKWLKGFSISDEMQCALCGKESCYCYISDTNSSDFDYEESTCSTPSCTICELNSTRKRGVSILSFNDDITFDDGPTIDKAKESLELPEKRQRSRSTFLSTASVRIKGLRIEHVQWKHTGSDLLLKVENRLFPVHREMLSNHSLKLKLTLEENPNEFILELYENLDDIKLGLNLLYGCTQIITESNVKGLMHIGKKYNIDLLIQACDKYYEIFFNDCCKRIENEEIKQSKFSAKGIKRLISKRFSLT